MKDIDDYIHSCVTCQRVNKRNEKPSNLLHCIEVSSPWHRIGVDLMVVYHVQLRKFIYSHML